METARIQRDTVLTMPLSPSRKILLFLLLFLAAAEFTLRGPVRVLRVRRSEVYNDSGGPYIGAKAWIKGLNPYSNDVFWTLWEQSGGAYGKERGPMGSSLAYPLTCYLLLAPLSFFSWRTAQALCGLLFVGMVLLSVWLLGSLPGFRDDGWRRWLFIALSLALAPFHTGIGNGNFSVPAVAFLLLSFWGSCTGRPVLAGVCCGLGISLKPPIGLFLVLYYAVGRRWRALGTALASTFLIAAAAVGRLQVAGVSWLSSYLADNKLVLTDPINGITAANPKRFQMVNLQVLWYTVTKNERMANALALLIGCTLLLLVLVVLLRPHRHAAPALEVSVLAVVCLLPVYHRYYDAALLILPLLWSLSPAPTKARAYQRLTLLLMLPFAVPGAWMLQKLQNADHIPRYLTARWWWDTLVMAHQIWALLLLALVLAIATWDEESNPIAAKMNLMLNNLRFATRGADAPVWKR